MRALLLLVVVMAACPQRTPPPDQGEAGQGEGEGEGEAGEFDVARAIACRAAGCFDGVLFCPDRSAAVVIGEDEFAGSYVVDGDRVTVSYDDTEDVFVKDDAGFVRERDGAEFANELADPGACD